MTEEYKVTLPKLGESILNATIVQWFKKVGESVKLDEPLLEVSTDKVNSEIPSPVAGTLTHIHAKPDQELTVGDLLAVISTAASGKKEEIAQVYKPQAEVVSTEMKGYYSPALLSFAQEKGISLDMLAKIPATGAGGRLTRKDLEAYLEKKPTCPGKNVEHVKMSGMRKAIADNMVRSFYEAPHATLITQVDITKIQERINREKESFQKQHGAKLTLTAFVAYAISQALKEFPLINSSLEGDTIVVKHFVNLGVAVSVDQGLMVPVIKNCQNLTLAEIARAIGDLSGKVRAGTIEPDDVREGTITLTNFGMTGIQIGIPIIRYPEVAIIGIGSSYKQVVPQEDDSLSVRTLMHASLTFDHRVLDGIYGCNFLNALKRHLEQ